MVVPLGALAYALTLGTPETFTYIHVMAGELWTGLDAFMGLVLGPVLGGLDPEERASVFARFTPKMTFLMPIFAAVTITGGIEYARPIGVFSLSRLWVQAALVIATLFSIQGFGVILPNEVRVYRELVSSRPDVETGSQLGMRNAKIGGLQGVMQLVIVFVMVNIA